MFSTFRLKKAISPNHVVDPDDTTRAKTALARLGFYRVPEWGITPFVDSPMMDSITAFQKANGLEVDGLMKPGGETERTIDHAIRSKNAAAFYGPSFSPIADRQRLSDREKDLCDDRYRRELSRCSRWPGKWHWPCAERATERWSSCYRYGYPPGRDREPPEWGPGDMEEWFNPHR